MKKVESNMPLPEFGTQKQGQMEGGGGVENIKLKRQFCRQVFLEIPLNDSSCLSLKVKEEEKGRFERATTKETEVKMEKRGRFLSNESLLYDRLIASLHICLSIFS